jgi:hypothetical protein
MEVTLPDIPAGPIFLGLISFNKSIEKSCDKTNEVEKNKNKNNLDK